MVIFSKAILVYGVYRSIFHVALTLPGELGVFFSWHHVSKKTSRPDLSQKDFAGWGPGIPVAVAPFQCVRSGIFFSKKAPKWCLENIVCHFLRQLWLVLGVQLMEINSKPLFSSWFLFILFDAWHTGVNQTGHSVMHHARQHRAARKMLQQFEDTLSLHWLQLFEQIEVPIEQAGKRPTREQSLVTVQQVHVPGFSSRKWMAEMTHHFPLNRGNVFFCWSVRLIGLFYI